MKIYAQELGKIDVPSGFFDLGALVSRLVILAYFAAALFFLIQVSIGGIIWLNAGGDPKALDAARARLSNAFIGLAIVVAAFGITIMITTVLGINIFEGTIVIN